ncbi:MAG: hypothetical protein HY010_23565 [Acidobacteria bacterium]|nr:hypothetical protein [Acidobacteriota bacterium]
MTPAFLRLLATSALCALLSGCAQTGPPLPPSLELPKPPSDLRAVRKGNRVTLSWSVPTRTTDRQTVRSLGPTRICRSLDAEVKECGAPVGELPSPSAQPSGSTQTQSQMFTDTLPGLIQQGNPSGDVTYAVEVLNRDSRSAGFSNRVTIPAMPTLPPPADFRAELTAGGVAFNWTATADTTAPAGVQYHYRIYRRDENTGKDTIVGESAVTERASTHPPDAAFEWEKTYLYRITSLSTRSVNGGDVQVEGDDSPSVRIIARDVFPPAVPSGVQAVYSGEGQKLFVDLIWGPVTDADLAGYNIYRREDGGSPAKLNADLVKSPAYRDPAVASGKVYLYSVAAVDVRGNESAHSDEASESVP